MKKSSLEWTLLILITFIFLGADNIFTGNFALAMKAVCIVGACADVYFLAVSYEKAISERQESFHEINRRIEEYLKTLREEQGSVLAESNEKLGNLVEKLMETEEEQSRKYAALTETMAEKNGSLFESTMEGIREFVQRETDTLVTEQKRAEETGKLVIENMFAEMGKRSDEQERQIEEYLTRLREEQENILSSSNEKLGNLVEKLMETEEEQSRKYAALTETMAEKNGSLFESTMEGIREFVQRETDTLVTEQKRAEETGKLVIENMLNSSNEKLGNLVEKLMEAEEEQSRKYAALTETMAERNGNLFESTMEGIREALERENESRGRYFEEAERKLSANIQGMIDVQNKNMDTTAALLKSNEEAYGYSMDELRKLRAIQEELVAKEKEVRDINEKILQDINAAMNEFVQVSGTVKDEVAALKAYMKAFQEKIGAKLEEHYEHMEDAVEDGNDELRDILENSGKNQVNAFSDQTKELKECVAQIEEVMNKSISAVTERNDRLLLDLERMQDEWTNLNKTEIEFLNKIWEE